ncbi:hypothetical protein MMC07_007166, partial [Pseudocyphellaria aurata]|nr:hypothetical protein [Pseudocyphellaria aurata]
MSTAPAPIPLGIAARLPPGGLIALIWGGVGLAFIFVAARTSIRIYKVERLAWDDYWIYFAWLILTLNGVLQTIQAPHVYYVARAAAGLVPAGEAILYHGNIYVRYEFASIGLFWTVLWAVKASFLAMFWRLFDGLPNYRKWLLCIAVFSFLAYAGCWIASILNCHPAPLYFKFGQCVKPIDLRGTIIAVSYSTTVDILTDVLIMALPFRLLYSVKITTKQKLGLFGVFGIATIIIVVAIIRAVQITTRARTDAVLLTVWSIIESTVFGCLPVFKTLFTDRTPTSGGHYSSKRSRTAIRSTLSSTSGKRTSSIPLQSYDNACNARGQTERRPTSESQEQMMSKRDEEMGAMRGSRYIRVQTDF